MPFEDNYDRTAHDVSSGIDQQPTGGLSCISWVGYELSSKRWTGGRWGLQFFDGTRRKSLSKPEPLHLTITKASQVFSAHLNIKQEPKLQSRFRRHTCLVPPISQSIRATALGRPGRPSRKLAMVSGRHWEKGWWSHGPPRHLLTVTHAGLHASPALLRSPPASWLTSDLLQSLLPLHSDICGISNSLAFLPVSQIESKPWPNSFPPPPVPCDPRGHADPALVALSRLSAAPTWSTAASADGNLTNWPLNPTRLHQILTTRILLILVHGGLT